MNVTMRTMTKRVSRVFQMEDDKDQLASCRMCEESFARARVCGSRMGISGNDEVGRQVGLRLIR